MPSLCLVDDGLYVFERDLAERLEVGCVDVSQRQDAAANL